MTCAVGSADESEELIKLQDQVHALQAERKYSEAIPFAQEMVKIAERAFQNRPEVIAVVITDLAVLYELQENYAAAEPLYQRSLKISEDLHGTEHSDVADAAFNLGLFYVEAGKYDEAKVLYQRSLTISEKLHGREHHTVASTLNALARVYTLQGEYAAAEPVFVRALAIREKIYESEHPEIAKSLHGLAALLHKQGRYQKAELLLQRSLRIREKHFGSQHPDVVSSLSELGSLKHDQGKFGEAEAIYHRCLTIGKKVWGTTNTNVAQIHSGLASLYLDQGRFIDAVHSCQRAISIYESVVGKQHPNTAMVLNMLGSSFRMQGNLNEAERLYSRALTILEVNFGANHPHVAQVLNNLATVLNGMERYDDAEANYRRSLAIDRAIYNAGHVHIAYTLHNLGENFQDQGHLDDAEPYYRQSLTAIEKNLGLEHLASTYPLTGLARLYRKQGGFSKAEPLIDRAIKIGEQAGVSPQRLSEGYAIRSRIAWDQHRHSEAFADLRTAMQLADQQRVQTAGAARERAVAFAESRNLFERMVRWQNEMGDRRDLTEVLSAIERGRARTLLDDMAHAGADLHAGRSAIEREALQQRELDLKQQIAILEKQLEQDSKSTELQAKLATARQALYDHYRDERNSSPVYRNLLSTGAGPPRLSQLQRVLASDSSLVLIYLLGDEGSYLLSIDSTSADLAVLSVDESAAKTLEIDAGPLTADRLQAALHNDQQIGVMQRLSRPETAGDARDQLAALWTTLVPVELRQQILDGRASTENNAGESLTPVRRLVVIPDGPLSLLPVETLVIDPRSDDPTYLLDVGPPIHYSPSATVLYNLMQRRTAETNAGGPQLLTVGDPNYAGSRQVASSNSESILDVLTPRSRYHGVGGQLSRLPNSGTEVRWVSSVFDNAGISGVALTGAKANESEVRGQLTGRRFIHLACHGLVDHNFGNLFGALAFSAGSNASQEPDNDGFLTLAEMHGLDLNACELAILSACQTNYGPQQKGEGVWAISRGFLVAGARRVVASNWLVDDEAAASLVSYFCGGVANAIGKEQDPDYAGSLQAAKRWVRNQEKWSSPYYWGTFVLVGPE